MRRRRFWLLGAGALAAPRLSPKERIDRVLQGRDADRTPFTFWYHFGLEKLPGERHARATLDFHRKFRTDLVKVMSDFPYPRPAGPWHRLRALDNPFPEQIRALELIRAGLAGNAYFLETIFNPWNVAEKLSSGEEVRRLQSEQPQQLLDALEAIARSEASHARRAIGAGASGVFLAVANAQEGILTREEYAKFSEPFDRMVLDAVRGAPLNTLHLHGEKAYLDRFFRGWPATVVQHSVHGTGVSMASVRRQFPGVLMGGLDETRFRKLERHELKQQWTTAAREAGARFIAAPGCSVPNDTPDEELLRVTGMFGA